MRKLSRYHRKIFISLHYNMPNLRLLSRHPSLLHFSSSPAGGGGVSQGVSRGISQGSYSPRRCGRKGLSSSGINSLYMNYFSSTSSHFSSISGEGNADNLIPKIQHSLNENTPYNLIFLRHGQVKIAATLTQNC